jgi:tetratricopeptide (TPR) repeat protein
MLSVWQEESENFEEALDAAHRFLELEPNNEVAHAILADAMLNCNDRSGAKRHFQRSVTLNPDYSYSGFSLFDLQLEDHQVGEAADTLELLETQGKAEENIFRKTRMQMFSYGEPWGMPCF